MCINYMEDAQFAKNTSFIFVMPVCFAARLFYHLSFATFQGKDAFYLLRFSCSPFMDNLPMLQLKSMMDAAPLYCYV